MPNQRRALLRLGALLLLIAAVFGLLTAAQVAPADRWMAAHVSTLMLGILVIAEGLLWQELRLTDGQRSAAYTSIVVSSWAGIALAIAGALLRIPGPVTGGGAQPEGIQTIVLAALLLIIVPTTIASWVLIWMGLRGKASE